MHALARELVHCRSEDKRTLRSLTALEAQHLLAMLFCSYRTSRALFTMLDSLCIMYVTVDTEEPGFRVSFNASLELSNYRQICKMSLPKLVTESYGPDSALIYTSINPV